MKLAKALDWPRLALEPGSFLDDNLREYHSDLLYSVTFITSQAKKKESKLGVYLLIEHKSEPDRHVHTQVLSYLSSIYKSKGQVFPVIPIVLYHGSKTWNIPPDFASTLNIPEACKGELLKYIPNFFLEIYNLHSAEEKELLVFSSALRAFLVSLKEVWKLASNQIKDLEPLIRDHYSQAYASDKNLIDKLLLYVLGNSDF